VPEGAMSDETRNMGESRGKELLYLQLMNMYAPAWGYGGPVRLMFDYAGWMSRYCRAAVFTGDLHHDFTRIPLTSEKINGISVYRFKSFFPKLAKRSVYLLSPMLLVRAICEIRASKGLVIVHFSELRGLVPLYAFSLKLLFRKRLLLLHSAFGSLHYKRSVRRRIYDAIFLKGSARLVDVRLAQNDHERDECLKLCVHRKPGCLPQVVVFPLHVNEIPLKGEMFIGAGKNYKMVIEQRRVYGVPENAIVFLFLGRLHPAKGIARMIDAFAEFSHSCSREALLLIVGRDDGFQVFTEGYIRHKNLNDKVRIVNNVFDNRFDYYYLADIFLGFPTIFEETMLASVEAMACGTPIIVSREADIPIVAEQQAGLIIDFEVRTAAEAMATIIRDLTAFQLRARSVTARYFNGDAAAAKFRSLIATLASGIPEFEEIFDLQNADTCALLGARRIFDGADESCGE
jgi:glycosyltransferase involved in cell wall biosynthesis